MNIRIILNVHGVLNVRKKQEIIYTKDKILKQYKHITDTKN